MKKKTLGQVLRSQRANMKLTQRVLAQRLNVKPSHVAYLETDQRRPSLALLSRIADVLGLEKEPLFLLAHPEAKSLLSSRRQMPSEDSSSKRVVWRDFTGDKSLLARHQIKPRELKVLAQVNLLGRVTAPRQYLFILNAIRHAFDAEQ
jgi:transcriptional regulator with XRE-family HTH domain